ncbi:MAG: hypothetical protein QXR74_05340 [Candidatus Bathyarchaeia archaeon]
MLRKNILIVSMLILILLAAPIAAVKHVAAKSTPGATSSQAEKGNDDILYLRRDTYNNLTTTAPNQNTSATITVNPQPGNRPNSVVVRWVNETAVPDEYNWTIGPGTYNFTFWISRTHQNIVVNVSFTFGYINATGHRIPIVTGQRTGLTPGTITWYNITVYKGESVSIKSGSRLFIDVTISVSGPHGQSATFYYDGTSQPTQIKTPSQISAEQVSEFPFGAVFLPPALLSAYFILKRRIVRFRA